MPVIVVSDMKMENETQEQEQEPKGFFKLKPNQRKRPPGAQGPLALCVRARPFFRSPIRNGARARPSRGQTEQY